MALITAADYLASREARKAGLDGEPEPEVTEAITLAEAVLYEKIGYSVEGTQPVAPDVAATLTVQARSGGDLLYLPERARSITSVSKGNPFRVEQGGFALRHIEIHAVNANTQPEWPTGDIEVVGLFGFEEGHAKRIIAEKVIRCIVTFYLQMTSEESSLPVAPDGGYMTGLTSEGVSFAFNQPTPQDPFLREASYLTRMLIHPARRSGQLKSIPLRSSVPRVTL